MNTTNADIVFNGTQTIEESLALDELCNMLAESNISATPRKGEQQPGRKDGGLTLAISIAGLALTAIGTLVSAITLWGTKRNYSITYKCGEVTISANNLSANEAREIVQSLRNKAIATKINILVSRNEHSNPS